MRLARGDHVVVRMLLLEHKMHCADIIRSVSPVAPRVEIAKQELGRLAMLNTRHRMADLPRNKFVAPARPFVVIHYAATAKQTVSLPIIHHEMEACDLTDPVWTSG